MQQPQYQIQQWDDAHLEELSVSDRVQLIRMEDAAASKLAKYEPVQDDVQPYKSPAHAVAALAQPVILLSVVAGAVYTVVVVVSAAVAAACTFIAANAVYIGGGVFALAVLVLGFSALSGSNDEPARQSSGGGQTINVTVNVAGQSVTNGK